VDDHDEETEVERLWREAWHMGLGNLANSAAFLAWLADLHDAHAPENSPDPGLREWAARLPSEDTAIEAVRRCARMLFRLEAAIAEEGGDVVHLALDSPRDRGTTYLRRAAGRMLGEEGEGSWVATALEYTRRQGQEP
jgi:hypothetical protein